MAYYSKSGHSCFADAIIKGWLGGTLFPGSLPYERATVIIVAPRMLRENGISLEAGYAHASPPSRNLRVLAVIPGDEHDKSSMAFARRQMSALEKEGVETRSFYLSSRQSPRVLLQELRRFRRVVHEFNPEIVHAHYGTVTALFCALATRRPLVVSFRGSDLNPTSDCSLLRSAAGRLFSQLSVLRTAHVICVSEELKGRLWLQSKPISIIFDGVNLSVFKPMPRNEARHALGWSPDKKLIFFNLGGRPAGKRLALAEGAVEFARGQFPSIELVTVQKVDPDKIPLFMNACDCLLLTSDWEGSPTVVKEAIACGLPVVSVDVGDVVSLLQGIHPARIVAPDTAALGNALIEILGMNTRSNGPSRADHVSEQGTTARILEIYKRVRASA